MARFTGGWLKVYREAWEKDLGQNIYLWGIWNALLNIVNWKESQIIWNGKQRILKPGECLFTVRELSDKWGCSPTTIWKWLNYLRDTGRLAFESRTHGTIVTICNWELYQHVEEEARTPSEHQVNTARTPSEHEVAYSKEGKKEELKKERNNHRRTRIEYPDDFKVLWKAYGNFTHKGDALRVYLGLKLDPDGYTALSRAVENYVKSLNVGQFRMSFARFLDMDWDDYANMEREEDWIPPELRGESERRVYQ